MTLEPMKKMDFNQKKCVKLHISKEERNVCPRMEADNKIVKCVFLKVQKCEMKSAEEEKYIGDVISSNCSNDPNVSKRRSQGIGAISHIFAILN